MKLDFHSGRRLALARKLKGLTQENLVGEPTFPSVNVKTLRRWEKDGVNLARIEDIASYFGSPIWIFTEESLDSNLFQRYLIDPELAQQHRRIKAQPLKIQPANPWFEQACDLMAQSQFSSFAQLVQDKDTNSSGANGWSLLMWAAHWDKPVFVTWLCRHGAKVNSCDADGFSPLIAASVRGNLESLTHLVAEGADLDHQDHQGWTALTWAASHNNLLCLEALLKAGASPNPEDQAGENPVMRAIRNHFIEVLELMATSPVNRPDFNQPNQQGQRPLHLSLEVNFEPAVRLLLDQGVDLSLTNHLGISPYDLASSQAHSGLKELLQSYL